MPDRDLAERLARFAGRLRERDVGVGLSDEIEGAAALLLVDPGDSDEVRYALRTALKVRRSDWDAFDELFRDFWAAKGTPAKPKEQPAEPRAAPPRPRRNGPDLAWRWLQAVAPPAGRRDREAAAGDTPGYSSDVLLRRKPFDDWCADDLPAMERLLARAARRMKCRPSRRLVPVSGRDRGRVDLRRSFRRAVGAGGEFLALARRDRAVERPDVVLLCDTSGSMDPHTRFLLTFALSLRRVVKRCQVFAFNTSLTRLTPWLKPGKMESTLDRLAAGVADWSGGTRIGASLDEFVTRYLGVLVSTRTVVVVLSDGLDRDNPTLLAGAMRAIRDRARRVVWLNPLLGDDRYRPEARGMRAALPFVDDFVPAHNLESLERLLPLLAARA